MTAPFTMVLVSIVAAVLLLVEAHGFGRGDLGWFLFWTLPLAAATWLIGGAMQGLRSRALLFNVVAIGTGLLAGFAWSVVVAVLHGVFIGAASIPFNFIWPFAAVAGLVASGLPPSKRGRVAGALILPLAMIAPLASLRAWPYAAGWQTLTVIKMKRTAQSPELRVVDSFHALTPGDIQRLRDTGVSGTVEVVGTATVGRGPKARALVVSTSPIEATVDVRQPQRSTAVYVQYRDRVEVLPPDTRLVSERLRFARASGNRSAVDISEEVRGGWYSGGWIYW
jgi:hypothetical protein